MNKTPRMIGIIVAVIIVAGIALQINSIETHTGVPVSNKEAPKPNFTAPAFTLKNMDGQQVRVGGKREKALLINFWASWCEPCRIEAPDLVSSYDKFKDKLDIYGVNITNLDDINDVKTFISEHKITFPVLLDEKGKIADQYKVDGYPTSFLIDKDGIVRDIIFGIVSPKELDRKLKQLAG